MGTEKSLDALTSGIRLGERCDILSACEGYEFVHIDLVFVRMAGTHAAMATTHLRLCLKALPGQSKNLVFMSGQGVFGLGHGDGAGYEWLFFVWGCYSSRSMLVTSGVSKLME